MAADYQVIGSVILSICNMVSVDFALWWVLVQYMVVFFVCKQTLDKIDSNGGKLRHQLIAYAQILQLINRRNFHSESGKEMQKSLADALPSFAQLEKILKGYDRRGNFLGLFLHRCLHAERFLPGSQFPEMEEYLYGEDGGMDAYHQRDGCDGFDGGFQI